MRRRVQADPASIAFAALAEEFRRMGRYEEAVETCRTGLQRHPAYLSAHVTLGRALIETGDYDAAREELETVLRSAPENLAAIRGLAQIHERLGHSTELDPALAEMVQSMEPVPVARPVPAAPVAAPVAEPIPEPVAEAVLEPVAEALAEPVAEVVTGPAEPPEEAPAPPAAADATESEPSLVDSLPVLASVDVIDLEPPIEETPPLEATEQDVPFIDLPLMDPLEPNPILPDVPDPAIAATLVRLEHLLAAIQHARHA
ncbi:MAG TPA: tetratricopeptide repeat protein [Vicinamibacterales bacterium]|nr:tetratricopeptide repeat protein [Vicinamibacterales bacterium]